MSVSSYLSVLIVELILSSIDRFVEMVKTPSVFWRVSIIKAVSCVITHPCRSECFAGGVYGSYASRRQPMTVYLETLEVHNTALSFHLSSPSCMYIPPHLSYSQSNIVSLDFSCSLLVFQQPRNQQPRGTTSCHTRTLALREALTTRSTQMHGENTSHTSRRRRSSSLFPLFSTDHCPAL